MKRCLLFFCLLPVYCISQNLLVNSGFEDENICIEYNVNCAPEGWIYTVPSFNYYFKDAKQAHSGTHFVSIIAGNSKKVFYRTFVRSQLLCGLRKDHLYQIEFYIKSPHPILDSIGIYFSSTDFLFEKRPYRQITPQVFVTDTKKKAVKGDTSWQQIMVYYKANGDEAFIALGNFSKIDITGSTGISFENNFFVSIDDISLIPVDPNESLCSDWETTYDEIYGMDQRHELLDRMIKYRRNHSAEFKRANQTSFVMIDTITLPDILFATNQSALAISSYSLLDSIQHSMLGKAVDSIVIEGHTDSIGTKDRNRKLGMGRATSIANYLKDSFPNTNIVVRSWASEKPVADNRTAIGREKNRRVEIYFFVRE